MKSQTKDSKQKLGKLSLNISEDAIKEFVLRVTNWPTGNNKIAVTLYATRKEMHNLVAMLSGSKSRTSLANVLDVIECGAVKVQYSPLNSKKKRLIFKNFILSGGRLRNGLQMNLKKLSNIISKKLKNFHER